MSHLFKYDAGTVQWTIYPIFAHLRCCQNLVGVSRRDQLNIIWIDTIFPWRPRLCIYLNWLLWRFAKSCLLLFLRFILCSISFHPAVKGITNVIKCLYRAGVPDRFNLRELWSRELECRHDVIPSTYDYICRPNF